ncbi:MAG: hypothetical protein O3A51_02345, partial [Verrucomicrobia bacterium]|nr:hypothetical protein [Verrucomicrobiota bacterium]
MMDKNAIWKWLILVVAVAFSLIVVTPPKDKIRLGIDLQGGTSITVELDEDEIRRDVKTAMPEATEEAINREIAKVLSGAQERTLEVIRNRVDSLGTKESIIYPSKHNRIVVQLAGLTEGEVAEAKTELNRPAFLQFRIVHKDNDKLVRELFEKRVAPEGYRLEQLGGVNYFLEDKSFPPEKRNRAYRERVGRFENP